MNRNITVRAGGRSFAATLEDNATARAFAALLPMTVTMNEMNGNEKYHYLSENLPTDSNRPGTIRNGDLMLYGSNCLVLFYETFSSSYSYTRIGRLDNPSGLASALGRGNVTVTFETPGAGVRGGAPGVFSKFAIIFKSFVTSQENFCKIFCLYSYSQGKNIFSFYPPFLGRLAGRSAGLSLF